MPVVFTLSAFFFFYFFALLAYNNSAPAAINPKKEFIITFLASFGFMLSALRLCS